MKLIIGGEYQGKLEYAVDNYPISKEEIMDGGSCQPLFMNGDVSCPKGIQNFHLYIKRRLEDGGNPMQEIRKALHKDINIIIISNEIGYGIVPMLPFEREYRETVGRICCYLAKESDEVVRVTCGIGKRIK